MNYLTVQLQALYAPKGVRVNAVLPGSTETGLTADFTMMAGGEAELLSHTGYAQRLALPREMAEPIVFINSDMASYISGERLIVDYGCTRPPGTDRRWSVRPPSDGGGAGPAGAGIPGRKGRMPVRQSRDPHWQRPARGRGCPHRCASRRWRPSW